MIVSVKAAAGDGTRVSMFNANNPMSSTSLNKYFFKRTVSEAKSVLEDGNNLGRLIGYFCSVTRTQYGLVLEIEEVAPYGLSDIRLYDGSLLRLLLRLVPVHSSSIKKRWQACLQRKYITYLRAFFSRKHAIKTRGNSGRNIAMTTERKTCRVDLTRDVAGNLHLLIDAENTPLSVNHKWFDPCTVSSSQTRCFSLRVHPRRVDLNFWHYITCGRS